MVGESEGAGILKAIADWIAAINIFAVLMGWIINLAAILTVLWYLVRLYEKVTGLAFHQAPFMIWIRSRGEDDVAL